jgi:hypothetical protein
MADDATLWGKLGEKWWLDAGEACGASSQQIKFAAARHGGATRVRAAHLAGYSGNEHALRSAGSRTDKTKAVENLMTMAAAAEADVVEDPVSAAEAKKRIGKLVRSPDAAIALKASELFLKMEQLEKERGQAPDDDGMGDWRFARDYLMERNGASAFMLLYRGLCGDLGHPANYPLFHDVHHLAMQEPFGKQIWDWAAADLNEPMRESLNEKLADPKYQLETRLKIWSEIGKKPPAPVIEKLEA